MSGTTPPVFSAQSLLPSSDEINPFQRDAIPTPHPLLTERTEQASGNVLGPDSCCVQTIGSFASFDAPFCNEYSAYPIALVNPQMILWDPVIGPYYPVFCPEPLYHCMNEPCPEGQGLIGFDRVSNSAQAFGCEQPGPEGPGFRRPDESFPLPPPLQIRCNSQPPLEQNDKSPPLFDIDSLVKIILEEMPINEYIRYSMIAERLSNREEILAQLQQWTIKDVRNALNEYWEKYPFSKWVQKGVHEILSKLHTRALLTSPVLRNLVDVLERDIEYLIEDINHRSFIEAIRKADDLSSEVKKRSEKQDFDPQTAQRITDFCTELTDLENLCNYYDHRSEILELSRFAKFHGQLLYPACFKLFPDFLDLLRPNVSYRSELKKLKRAFRALQAPQYPLDENDRL